MAWPGYAALLFVLLGAGFVAAPAARPAAHEELELRIERVTQALRSEPRAGDLFLERARLYRLHGEWPEALADLERALTAGADGPLLRLERARLYQALGWHRSVLEELGGPAARGSGEEALLRARALAGLARHATASEAFSRALLSLPHPEPDLYLERARSQVAAGWPVDAIVADLEQGLQRLGSVPALQLRIVRLEAQAGRLERALQRLDVLQATQPGRVPWLVEQADLLAQADRPADAHELYCIALNAIANLSTRQRQTTLTLTLEGRARAGAARTSSRT